MTQLYSTEPLSRLSAVVDGVDKEGATAAGDTEAAAAGQLAGPELGQPAGEHLPRRRRLRHGRAVRGPAQDATRLQSGLARQQSRPQSQVC